MTVTLAFSAGPIRNTEITPRELDWNGLVEALTHPKVGEKDGSYFTRGPAPTNKRTNESIPYADIVILDGDSRIVQDTGEVLKGAPPPALVSDALKDAGIDHIIYTTHSHAPPLNKYRVVIPADRHRPEDVTDCVEYLIEQLHIRGVYLANVSENMAWGQGWFLPRLSVPDAPFETYVWNGGLSLDVRTALAWGEENGRIKRAMEAPMVKTPSVSRRDGSVIEQFNRAANPEWVRKLIPANGLCVLYGKPGTYKSFVAIYLSAHIAAGLPTLSSRATKQGAVVYIAAEGRGGLHQRWNALQSHYEIPADVPLYFVEASLDLRESDQDYLDLVAAIQKRSAVPRLIVVDTLARTFGGGDENDASEMSQFINTIGNLQEQFGCAVMAIHHSGKDETRGMRGSSALLGAA
ncbi:MAG: hypothetical protein EBR58_12365, partial [Betaproteobacteria bacterium]|nr:hypothetical protein [Betaproteobacteria bacterium]